MIIYVGNTYNWRYPVHIISIVLWPGYYIDTWALFFTILVVSSPDYAPQMQQQHWALQEERDREREHLLSLTPELPFGPQIIQVVKFS